jgi:hypothetical protein
MIDPSNFFVFSPDMTMNRYKYFRWTKRTARITFAYCVVVPTIIGALCYWNDVSVFLPGSGEEVNGLSFGIGAAPVMGRFGPELC